MRKFKSLISLTILSILFSGIFVFSQEVQEELVEDEFVLSPELVKIAEDAKEENSQSEQIITEEISNETEIQIKENEPELIQTDKLETVVLQKENEINSISSESSSQSVTKEMENNIAEKDFLDEIPVEKEFLKLTEKIMNTDVPLDFTDEELIPSDELLEENNEEEEFEEEELPPVRKYELPYEGMDRPEVEKFRQMYLAPKWTKMLNSYLETALAYRLYVRKSIEDKELPEMLEYLPVVESNYKTHAKSSSGAIGLWQFMANSVAPFLALNDYVDERYDPWKSTDAALKKLTDNYNIFGDWLIAIAAYNCGAGAMTRALKKSEEKSFWALVDQKLIPSQTANYVPKLLAITDLAINHEYFGIDLNDHEEEYETLYNEKNAIFDYITVNKAYSLSQLAQEMRIDTATLKELNPSYILGFTHPSKESSIRLPLGMEESALTALASISPIEFPFKYKVEAGDSLWSISRRYGVTVDAICEINGIKENALLQIGKILYIPKK